MGSRIERKFAIGASQRAGMGLLGLMGLTGLLNTTKTGKIALYWSLLTGLAAANIFFFLRLEARTMPPHHVEVDAIRQNSSQIFHKVHFPDKSSEVQN